MLIQVLISGIALGSIYALVGLSMVFIWKTTTVLNFAQGEMAMITTYFAYMMMTGYHFPYWAGFLLALVLGVIIGIVMERVIRFIPSTDPLAVLLFTIGAWFAMHGAASLIWGHNVWPFHSPFPEKAVSLLGAAIAPIDFGIFGVMVLLTGGLFAFLNFTNIGISFRATSQDPTAATLMGISTRKVFSLSWAIGGVVGAIAGVVVAPLIHLHVSMMGDILLKSFAAAVLGGINSLPGAIVGGLVLGLVSNMFGAYVGTSYQDSLAFFIIIVILLIRPQGIMGRREATRV